MKNASEVWVALSRIPALLADVHRLAREFATLWRAFARVLCRLLRCRRAKRQRRDDRCCIELPPEVHKRPDPLIYSQYYLMKMGLAVTWDNPDIQLYEWDPSASDGLGPAVSSSQLKPDHRYRVRVRVWNGSYDAPAVGLPVHLSFLSFGAGTVSTMIGSTQIDLGVKGSPHAPAFAYFDWRTPSAGHYCLQARLEWGDDANPDNNLGQENVEIGVLHSPAEFRFALRNSASTPRRFVVEADSYVLPPLPFCTQAVEHNQVRTTRLAESRARWERVRGSQRYGLAPVPAGWSVVVDPAEVSLGPEEERLIRVVIEPKEAHAKPPQTFNIHAFALGAQDGRTLAGGVTLHVT